MKQTIIHIPHAAPITVEPDFDPTIDNVRRVVGGDAEIVRIRPGMLAELCTLCGILPATLRTGRPDTTGTQAIAMYVNEMGAVAPALPLNPAASCLYGGPFWFLRQTFVHGDVVVLEIY